VSERRSFPNMPAAVRAARVFVLDEIDDVSPNVREAVAIAVSELATNSVRYGATGFEVEVARTPNRLRVEVSDSGRGMPVLRAPDPSTPSGRGLLAVGALADEWGVSPAVDGPGKCVWFTIGLSMRPTSLSVGEAPPISQVAASADRLPQHEIGNSPRIASP